MNGQIACLIQQLDLERVVMTRLNKDVTHASLRKAAYLCILNVSCSDSTTVNAPAWS